MIRERTVKIVVLLVGLLFTASLYPLLRWQPDPAEQMLRRRLCHPGSLPLARVSQPVSASQPDRVHRVVEPGSRCDYGGAGIPRCDPAGRSDACRASVCRHRRYADRFRSGKAKTGRHTQARFVRWSRTVDILSDGLVRHPSLACDNPVPPRGTTQLSPGPFGFAQGRLRRHGRAQSWAVVASTFKPLAGATDQKVNKARLKETQPHALWEFFDGDSLSSGNG